VPKETKDSDLANAGEPPAVIKAYRVAYKYKEGNSAAVRKPVKIDSLL
jgi:hypothetical protein